MIRSPIAHTITQIITHTLILPHLQVFTGETPGQYPANLHRSHTLTLPTVGERNLSSLSLPAVAASQEGRQLTATLLNILVVLLFRSTCHTRKPQRVKNALQQGTNPLGLAWGLCCIVTEQSATHSKANSDTTTCTWWHEYQRPVFAPHICQMCQYLEGVYRCVRLLLRVCLASLGFVWLPCLNEIQIPERLRRFEWGGWFSPASSAFVQIESDATISPSRSRRESTAPSRSERPVSAENLSTETALKMSALSDLRDTIIKRRTSTHESKISFFPIDSMREIVIAEAVTQVLQELPPETQIPPMAHWFSNDAIRLFAIIIVMKVPENSQEKLRLIQNMYDSKICDEMLPMQNSIDPVDGLCKLKPCKAFCKRKARTTDLLEIPLEVFSICSKDQGNDIIICFRDLQNLFLSPVFRNDQFEYNFGQNEILPFTKLGKEIHSGNGIFSSVRHAVVQSGHLEVHQTNLVSLCARFSIALTSFRRLPWMSTRTTT
jgi:hypothetical protein